MPTMATEARDLDPGSIEGAGAEVVFGATGIADGDSMVFILAHFGHG